MTQFLIPPADLEARRNNCKLIVDRLLRFQQETVSCCNVCGSSRHAMLALYDRYGFPFRNAMCLDCGLFYLVDRFTAAGYSDFYRSGAYRTAVCQFNGWTHAIGQLQTDQVAYAKILIRVFSGVLPQFPDGKLLDVGGSAGMVALELAREFGLRGTVIDPATEEVAAAQASGLKGVVGLIEEWETSDKFDLILLCRGIEHMGDLRLAMTRIRDLLSPFGLLYVDIVDFMEMCRTSGAPETFVKVDHCYWLTQATALGIFRALGFELFSMNIIAEFGAGFLLRRCEPSPIVTASGGILEQLEEIRKTERKWRAFGGTIPANG